MRAIADAVLYEGYVLWPYRRSAMKNRKRWTFGGVFPPAWTAEHPDDRDFVTTQVLVRDDAEPAVTVRFLQVVHRQPVDADGRPVDRLGDVLAWDEAIERELGPGPFAIAEGRDTEQIPDGAVVRSWHDVRGEVATDLAPAGARTWRVTVTVRNATPVVPATREEALRHALCSTHTILRSSGTFVSATEAAGCENVGTWPVLVEDGIMLSSPIILDDRPRIAPESPGDLFDGGEIDQLLYLNILALTDAEKDEMRASDPRARAILERCEGLTDEQLMRLHGTVR